MSGSTTNLDLISQSQSSKEITANAMFDAASPAMFGGRRASTCTGLTWGYYGGEAYNSNGNMMTVANGTLTLAANATNRVYVSNSGTVAVTGSTPAADEQYVLYTVVTGASSVTSYSDIRTCFSPPWFSSRGSIDVAAADATLGGYSRRVKYLTITGALTVNRNVITPTDVWQGYVFNNTSGAYTVTVKTSGGTGVVVGQGKRCILLADGTNVVRITADV
jgi:hypothetical protein